MAHLGRGIPAKPTIGVGPRFPVPQTVLKTLSGDVTPAGVLVKQTQMPTSGALTPAGVLVRQTQMPTAGAITPAGVLVKSAQKLLLGAFTPSGVMSKSKVTLKTLSGAITPTVAGGYGDYGSGYVPDGFSVIKLSGKLMIGALTPSGIMSKSTQKTSAGAITPSGSMTKTKIGFKVLVGALTPTGLLVRHTNKTLSGSLTPSGAMTKILSAFRTFAGALTPSGVMAKLKVILRVFNAPRIFSESFNTTDGTTVGPDLSWTEVSGDFTIVSNELAMDTISTPAVVRADISASDNQWAEVTVGAATVITTRIGVAVRINGAGDTYYEFDQRLDGVDDTRIRKSVSGVFSNLVVADGTTAIVQGDVLRLEVVGNHLVTYLNGTAILETTDDEISSGNPGVYGSQSGSNRFKVDSFNAGSLFAPTSLLTKNTSRTLSGSLTPAGVMTKVKSIVKTLVGALTPTGLLVKQDQKTLAGSLTPSGVMAKVTTTVKALAGALTPSGLLIKQPRIITEGSLTPAGVLTKVTGKLFSGALTPSGVLIRLKVSLKEMSGSITPAGVLLKSSLKTFVGALTPAGVMTKIANKVRTFAGALTPAGVMIKSKLSMLTMTGALTPTGLLVKRTSKVLTATQVSVGILTKRVTKLFSGAITPSGVMAKVKIGAKAFIGGITPTGLMLRLQNKALAGNITPIGVLSKSLSLLFSGLITPVGNLITEFIEALQLPGRIYHAIRRSNIYHAKANGTYQSNGDGWGNGFDNGFGD